MGGARYRLVIGVVAVALIGGLGWWMSAARDDACSDAASAIDAVWNDAKKAELRHAYEHTEVAYARDAWGRTEAAADRYFDAWSQASVQACEQEIETQCLEARLSRAAALLGVMADAKPDAIANGIEAFAVLGAPARCLDVDRGQEGNAGLDRIAAMVALGDGGAALSKALELEEAEAALLVGRVLVADERPEEAIEALGRGFDAARQDERSDLASAAAVAMGRALVAAGRRDDAAQWAEKATVAAERRRQDIRATLEAAALEASLESTDALGRVVERAAAELGQSDPTTIAIAVQLGEAALRAGDHDEARRAYDDARERRLEALGADHPGVAVIDLALARIDLDQGRIDAAKATTESAADALRSSLGPRHDRTVDAVALLAAAHARAGERDDAQRLLTGALEISRRAKGPDHPRTRRLAEQLSGG